MSIQLLDTNHYDYIHNAFGNAEQKVSIISPFIQPNAAKLLADAAKRGVYSVLITRFYREDFIKSVSSLQALETLVQAGVKVLAVKKLHTKLYLFDSNIAIVGSANFTSGGLLNNIELSLALDDEPDVLEMLDEYFSNMVQSIESAGDFVVTSEKIGDERRLVQRAIKGRDATSKQNDVQFGADIESPALATDTADPVETILSFSQGESSAVLKFQGQAHERYNPNEKYSPNYSEIKGLFFTSSPSQPRSLTSNKQIFLAAVSWDSSGAATPIIVGRAKTYGFDSSNISDEAMQNECPWTIQFPFYVEIYDIEIVDALIAQCISLNDLISEVGYRLYPNTSQNSSVSIQSLKNRHLQKSYIHVTPYAADRINLMLDELFNRYGIRHF